MLNRKVKPYTKEMQTRSKRIKPTQRQMGDISAKVDKELKTRSRGLCEVRRRCTGAPALERAHMIGRRLIDRRTSVEDLMHACVECHRWLDESPEGIRFKRIVREIGTTAYLNQR